MMNRKRFASALFAGLVALSFWNCGNGSDEAATPGADVARTDTTAQAPPADSTPAILFVGTSLTAGYGLENVDLAYPALIQQKIDSAGYHFRVINAGVSGETSAGGANKIDWILSRPFDVLVLELGANDGLRGLPVAQMRSNLEQILDATRKRYPAARIVIAGMEAPPNLGPAYTTAFHNTFPELARTYDAALVPFLLENVAGIDRLNQADGLHPTPEGQRIVAANVWKVLEPVLRTLQQRR